LQCITGILRLLARSPNNLSSGKMQINGVNFGGKGIPAPEQKFAACMKIILCSRGYYSQAIPSEENLHQKSPEQKSAAAACMGFISCEAVAPHNQFLMELI